ncbi:MAG TPA: thioesterase family protein [Bacteroidia bacterium]|nr:thioesterase family protein [Bacteroidia bacterium]
MAQQNSIPPAEAFRHRTSVEVRFADMDSFGHVNNAKFLTFIEQARIKYFDDISGWHYDSNKEGVILAHASLDFIRPLDFKEKLSVLTMCISIGTKSISLVHRIIAGEEEIATAESVLVAFDYVMMKSISVPQKWREAIENFEKGIRK